MEKYDVVKSYIEDNYEQVQLLKDDGSVSIIRNTVDDKLYVRKHKKVYNLDIYKRLCDSRPEGVPTIYEIYEGDDELVIIEDYIDGVTLDKRVEELSGASDKEKEAFIVEIGTKLCEILSGLHNSKPPIIHRDIKPENVCISGDELYLLDFNISREYKGMDGKDTFVMGTPEYAAPEQFGFSESDARTDIYALGITLRFMRDKLGITSAKLDHIIEKATKFDPKERYKDANEVRAALRSKSGGTLKVLLKRYALPGFRQGKPINMAVAIAFYALWATCMYDFHMGNNYYEGIYGKIYDFTGWMIFFLMVAGTVLFDMNYLGIQTRLCPWLKTKIKNVFLRILILIGIDILYSAMVFLLGLLVTAIVCEGHAI